MTGILLGAGAAIGGYYLCSTDGAVAGNSAERSILKSTVLVVVLVLILSVWTAFSVKRSRRWYIKGSLILQDDARWLLPKQP